MINLTSFDGTESEWVEVVRPDRYRQLFADIDAARRSIPRGSGLSYCAASFGKTCSTVDSHYFNRILAFDEMNGQITLEPGVKVGDLLSFAKDRGWRPPVLPGHPMITVGGCAAFNVHGKSQFHEGNFADHIEEFGLYHPDHGEIQCSRRCEAELFDLSLGGMGLTGFITNLTLRLIPHDGGGVIQKRIPVCSLNEAVALMRELLGSVGSVYSWNDLNRRSKSFGAGLVFACVDSEDAVKGPWRSSNLVGRRRRLPFSIHGRLMTPIINRIYGYSTGAVRERVLDRFSAEFPISGQEIYYDLFGRKGFREYQMLFSDSSWEDAKADVEKAIIHSAVPVTLGSLKLFEGSSSLLKFSGSGICLTVDAPNTSETKMLFSVFDDIVKSHQGVVNVSKDSRLTAEAAQSIFREYEEFLERIHRFDPDKRFDSSLRRRLLGKA